mgnify:CR=1 FL=1
MIKLEYKRNDSTKFETQECISFGFSDVGIKYPLDTPGVTRHLLYKDVKEWKASGKISQVQIDSCNKLLG